MLGAGQFAHAQLPVVAIDDTSETGPRQKLNDLSKRRLAAVYDTSPNWVTRRNYTESAIPV
jgi:hypothetical protein